MADFRKPESFFDFLSMLGPATLDILQGASTTPTQSKEEMLAQTLGMPEGSLYTASGRDIELPVPQPPPPSGPVKFWRNPAFLDLRRRGVGEYLRDLPPGDQWQQGLSLPADVWNPGF